MNSDLSWDLSLKLCLHITTFLGSVSDAPTWQVSDIKASESGLPNIYIYIYVCVCVYIRDLTTRKLWNPPRIGNHMPNKVWDEFTNTWWFVNGCNVIFSATISYLGDSIHQKHQGDSKAILSCNMWRSQQNGRHVTEISFKRTSSKKLFCILIKYTQRFVPKVPSGNMYHWLGKWLGA